MPKYYPLKITNINPITDRSVVVTFGVPEKLQEVFRYKAGQYLSLETTIEKETVRRSYSICSPPESGMLQVGIKQIPNGVFSTYANKSLAVGDIINVGVPEGRFVYTPKERPETIVAFASGSGITPIWSIAQSALSAHQDNQFVLVYGNKSIADTMFYDAIAQLEQKHPDRFRVHRIYSQTPAPNSAFGRIDQSVVQELLKALGGPAAHYYLCGPEQMILDVSMALEENKVPKAAVSFELFTASNSSASDTNVVDEAVGQKVEIICDDVRYQLENIQNKIILDAALNQKIDVPYSCQGGVCSSCIARVKEGQASMDNNQILTESEIAEGLILSCQARAQTATLVVDFDDV